MTFIKENILQSFLRLKSKIAHTDDGREIIRSSYEKFYGKPLSENPATLSEKITQRMISLHDYNNPTFTRLSDKFLMRDFVKERIGDKYLNDLLWHGTDPARIPFDDLPDRCMAKTNHASGTNQLLIKPVDRQKVIRRLRKWMKRNYYYSCREMQYKLIKPRILVERFIDDGNSDGPLDYRFWCFDGIPEVIQVDNNDASINPFFDLKWNRLPFSYRNHDFTGEIPKPENLSDMIDIAIALSSGFDFVRVDLYKTADSIIVGELTFTPLAGLLKIEPACWDATLGEKWTVGAPQPGHPQT